MKINFILFTLFIPLVFFSNCTTDYFGFSSSEEGNNSQYLQNPTSAMAYCNKFDSNGFSGFLVAYYDWDKDAFNKNKARLYLEKVPYEFTYPPTNYIQVHSFYIANNKKTFNKIPVSMDVVQNSTSEKSILITTIGHDLLVDMGEIPIDQLIQKHSFILRDVNGWHGITLSVFDLKNKPIKIAQVLIPPFDANPNTFLNTHNRERLLSQLHPFSNISNTNTTDQSFYEKALDFCKESPAQFNVPPFKPQPVTSDPVVDKLIEELSFLPGNPSQ